MIPKKKEAKKFDQYRTITLTSHPSKLLTCIIYRRIDGEVGEDKFGFRKARETREAILAIRLCRRKIEKKIDLYGIRRLGKIFYQCGLE